ncbi:MAG: hypothetical protein IT208_14430 [Chthonomonadales bacterium]|nr:hypothetical protein [Chthonomonadales bacterium]
MKSCPQCHLWLERVDLAAGSAWCCRSCGGSWFSAGHLAPAIGAGSLRALNADFPGHASAGAFEGLPLPCPECATVVLEPAPDVSAPTGALRCPRCAGSWLSVSVRRAAAPLVAEREPPAQLAAEPEPPAQLAAEPEPPVAPAEAALQQPEAAPGPVTLAPPPWPVDAPPSSGPIGIALPAPASATPSAPSAPSARPAPPQALRWLLEGNGRFAEGRMTRPNQTPDRRAQVARRQQPMAVVLGCSDSRVPPEILFDQGVGDLFVIRTAGAILDDAAEASIQLAIHGLAVPLVVVLGHERCAAVTAAVANEGQASWALPILRALEPAVRDACGVGGDRVAGTVQAHVRRTAAAVRGLQPVVAPKAAEGSVTVVGAYYDLDTGRVQLLDDEDAPASAHVDETVSIPVNPGPVDEEHESTEHIWITNVTRRVLTEPFDAAADRQEAEIAGSPEAEGPARWCPRCRRGYGPELTFCNQCGVALVQPWFLVQCSRCRRRNRIEAPRCEACGTDLHPGVLESAAGAPPDLDSLVRMLRTRRGSSTTSASGCAGTVLAALAAWALVAVAIGGALAR